MMKRLLKYSRNSKTISKGESVFSAFLESIFREESICYICGEFNPHMKSENICGLCSDTYRNSGRDCCSICGRRVFLAEDGEDLRCRECIRTAYEFDLGISAFMYSGEIQRLVADFKYREKLYLKDFFSRAMAEAAESRMEELGFDIREIDIASPVPMEKGRERARGYNQADVLGRLSSEMLGLKYEKELLKRVGRRKNQRYLNRAERLKNLKGSIELGENADINGKSILLIDDVYTTGATIDECSRVLKKNGAAEVYFLTLASTAF